MRLMPRTLVRCLLTAAVLFCGGLSPRATTASEPAPEVFRLAFMETAFKTVNLNDAKAALSVWVEYIQKNRNISERNEIVFFPDVQTLASATRAGQVDLVGLSVAEYLRLREHVTLAPLFFAARRGRVDDQYLLLTHKNGSVTSLADLRNDDILLYDAGHMPWGQAWLATLARAENKPLAWDRIQEVPKVLSALLPVLTGQKKACVLSRSSFDSASEMNPQLARELTPLRASDPMPSAMVCLRSDFSRNRAVIEEELARLHESPRGQQILMLIKFDRLVPFQEGELAPALKLLRSIDELPSTAGGDS